ncbi:hypothetical protein PBAL39_13402 [Pedobacter sp. BAL39]|uniref:beta strand repeat-containing protein n=1 Tax=Pedobacter sp. BAL39 TaxID=391596 RepID=UPI0001559962|nr:hypothetical protein [Pedobacter sp. BAL39]EDM35231.1 hypothetical protein PBAL39_13402 [Pedobacter sp. BAL39]
MKKLLTLALLLISSASFSQVAVVNADSVWLGNPVGIGGVALYGKIFLKNMLEGDAKDSILVIGANAHLKYIKVSSIRSTKVSLGLGNVENTSDLNKPISTATQAALNNKQNLISLTTTGSGAATFNATTGALNIPTFTITPSNLALGIRTATALAITNSNGTGLTLPVATNALAGTMSSADKAKLDGIAAGATTNIGTVVSVSSVNTDISVATGTSTPVLALNSGTGANQVVKRDVNGVIPNVLSLTTAGTGAATFNATTGALNIPAVTLSPSDLALGARTTTTVPVTNSNGTGVTLPIATTALAGIMSSADKLKLDGIIAGATANTGTVTSVGVTVPAGLSVSGSPVTTSGTIALGLQSGYAIPTTAKQTQWDTAAGWGNHTGLYLPLSGGTLTGSLNGTSATFSAPVTATDFTTNSPSPANRGFLTKVNGVNRWGVMTDNAAEPGANAGSNFSIKRFSDTGTELANSMSINRATGAAAFEGELSAKNFTSVSTGTGYASRSFHGLRGDYTQNGNSDKIIWTIGDTWNTIATMYGIGYQFASKYVNGQHQIVFRENGSVKAAINLSTGGAFFDGYVNSPAAPVLQNHLTNKAYVDGLSNGQNLQLTTNKGNITSNTLFITGGTRPTGNPNGSALYMQNNASGVSTLESYDYATATGARLVLNPNGGPVVVGNTTPITGFSLTANTGIAVVGAGVNMMLRGTSATGNNIMEFQNNAGVRSSYIGHGASSTNDLYYNLPGNNIHQFATSNAIRFRIAETATESLNKLKIYRTDNPTYNGQFTQIDHDLGATNILSKNTWNGAFSPITISQGNNLVNRELARFSESGNFGINWKETAIPYKFAVYSAGNTTTTSSFLLGEYFGALVGTRSVDPNYYAFNVVSGVDSLGRNGTSLFKVSANGASTFSGSATASTFVSSPTGGGFASRTFHGLRGDYTQNGTTDKIIWTIGDNWNTIENMYGLGYQFNSKYATGQHQIVFKHAGNVTASVNLTNGAAYFDGPIASAPAPTIMSHLANKGYVDQQVAIKANLASPTFTGTVTAPTFAGAVNGNATSAAKLQTPRTINGVPFDGTANITIPTTDATVSSGSFTPVISGAVGIASYTSNLSFYTKIGSIVTVTGSMRVITNSTSSGTLVTFYSEAPVSPNFANTFDVSGVAVISGYAATDVIFPGKIAANSQTNATITFIIPPNITSSSFELKFNYTYKIN